MANSGDYERPPLQEPLFDDPALAKKDEKEEEEFPPMKSDSLMRWPVLMLSCTAMIGNYYCYDNPAALKTQLQEFANLNEQQYNLLYTVYSIPNIILPFFGGYLCDMLGASRAFSIFASFLVGGQVVFAFGTSIKSIYLMYLGRVIYGLGGENMAVGASVLLNDWFTNKEMALAMALNVAVSRIGSVVNNILSPILADSAGVPFALWFGAMVCGGSLTCTLFLYPIDQAAIKRVKAAKNELKKGLHAEKHAHHQRNRAYSAGREISVCSEVSDDAPMDSNPLAGLKDVGKFQSSFWLLTVCCLVVYGCVLPFNNVVSTILLERDYFKPQTSNKCALLHPNYCQNSTNGVNHYCEDGHNWQVPLPDFVDKDKVVCTDKDYKKSTGDKCAHEYCDRENSASKTAATIFSIPYFMSATLSPFLGGAVDLIGGRALICFFSAATLVVVHSLLAFSSITPVVPMVGQGLAYSMFAAALWPSVPYLVPDKSVGIAYGVVTAVQNAGLAGIPLLVSAVYEIDGAYIPKVEIIFIVFAASGALCAILLNLFAPQLNHKRPFRCPDPDENNGSNSNQFNAQVDDQYNVIHTDDTF